MGRLDLNKLKEALDKGEVFEDKGHLDDILKNSEDISDMSKVDRKEFNLKREKRIEESWKNATEEDIRAEEKDAMERVNKREEAEKNEMVLAKIQYLENEISIYNEYNDELQHQMDMNQTKIDDINAQIEVLKKDIKE